MNEERIQTLEQVKQFVEGNEEITFQGVIVKEKYEWIEEVLGKFKYLKLKRAGKGLIRSYILKVTAYSRTQIASLTGRYQRTGKIRFGEYSRHRFSQRYTTADVALLAATDELHSWLSGPATKKILERECQIYRQVEYTNLSVISVAQIYNLADRSDGCPGRYRPWEAGAITRLTPVIAIAGTAGTIKARMAARCRSYHSP